MSHLDDIAETFLQIHLTKDANPQPTSTWPPFPSRMPTKCSDG